MMHLRSVGFAVIFFAGVLTVPAQAAGWFGRDPVVGRMGEVEMTLRQLKELINAQIPETQQAILASLDNTKSLINSELLRLNLLNEAKKLNWENRPDVLVAMARAKDQAVIENFLVARSQPPAIYPSESEIQAAYSANQAQFVVPSQVRLAQILIRVAENATQQDRSRAMVFAQEISTKIARGEDFATLAQLYSQDQVSKAAGGVLEWLAEASLSEQIQGAVKDLKVGAVTKPLQTPFGWQILKVIDRAPAGVRPLEQVHESIVKTLRAMRVQENRQAYIDALTKKNEVSLDEKSLQDMIGNAQSK